MIVFLVGAPGVGKTTLARQLIGPDAYLVPKPKWTVGKIVAAGHYNGGTFDGADTVPYNGVEDCLRFWEQQLEGKDTLFDGDRFSHEKVVKWAREKTLLVKCIYLHALPDTLAARRKQRGSNQNETWLKGRMTKAANFQNLFASRDIVRVHADVSPEEIYKRVVGEFGWR